MIISNKKIKINLPKEHGGCWNVEHFADEPVDFTLDKSESWIEIRYANIDKVHFYSEKTEVTMQKAYLVKGDIVYIEKIDGNWAFCSYRAKKTTKGWIKLSELNHLD